MGPRTAGALLLVVATVPLAAQEEERLTVPTVTFSYTSDPGDTIGQGGSGTVTSANGPWRLKRNSGLGVDLIFNQLQNNQWNFCFEPPSGPGQLLASGSFPSAVRCISSGAATPGLDVGHGFSGCNTVTGDFQVNSLLYDYYGWPLRFTASFDQHCEGATPALHGTLNAALGTVGEAWISAENLVVVRTNRLFEFTRAGALRESFPVMLGTSTSPTGLHAFAEVVRDAVMGPDGRLYIFNGTGTGAGALDVVQLSVFDTRAGTWEHHPVPGWSIWESPSDSHAYGGVALHGDYVFATDMLRNGDDRGIVRFDTANGFSVARFSTSTTYIDLNVGWNGLLYALRLDKFTVDVFDPSTPNLDVVGGPIVLDDDANPGTAFTVCGITADATGEMFGVRCGGRLERFNASGQSLGFLNLSAFVPTDIDLEEDGTIIVAYENGRLRFTSTAMAGSTEVVLPDPTNGTGIDRPGLKAIHIAAATAGPNLFDDGFESSDTGRWSAVAP
ncbi:MAG: hypothetical protein KBI44_03035 [Thermoanaerobaculia bacterium]|nr:hypothetical protein [Thermoanaerobaculia bacterium]